MRAASFFAAVRVVFIAYKGVSSLRPELRDEGFSSKEGHNETVEDDIADGFSHLQGQLSSVERYAWPNLSTVQPDKGVALTGNWTQDRQLKGGAYGVVCVYKVTCNDEAPYPVAVKMNSDAKHYEMTQEEGTLLASLSSDYVVRLVGPGNADCATESTPVLKRCLFMQYFNRGDLTENWGGLTDADRTIYFWQVVKGVSDMHNAKSVHLDIKPDNVLINCEDDKCYAALIDLGLSKKEGDTLNKYVGTVGYMAPEVSPREPVTGASDVWSLGVLLQWLFSGDGEVPCVFPTRDEKNANGSKQQWMWRTRGKALLTKSPDEDKSIKKWMTGAANDIKKNVAQVLWKIYVPFPTPPPPRFKYGYIPGPRLNITELLAAAEGLVRQAAPDLAEEVLEKSPEEYGARKPPPSCLK